MASESHARHDPNRNHPSINKTCAYTLREADADQICAYCALAGPGPSGLQKLIFEHVRSGARLSTVTERRVCQRLTLLVDRRTLFGILILHHQSHNNLVESKSGRMPPSRPGSSGTLKEYITAVLTDFA